MQLGVSLGYLIPGTDPADHLMVVQEAERLGYDSVWAAEAYGSDTATVLAWLAAGGAAAFAYLLMVELGAQRRLAATLALLMSVSPPFLIVAIRHGRNTDIATVFFMMAAR